MTGVCPDKDVRDILFARRNDNAEMLEDLHYDQETGLVCKRPTWQPMMKRQTC
ncbi:MAG: hypothetical protein ACLUOI_11345 [Eisenbergiella sp.]